MEPIDRRSLLLLGAAGALSSCGVSSAVSTAASTPAPTLPANPATSAATSGTRRPAVSLPAFEAWQPHAGEEEVACKSAAVRRIETAGNGAGRRLHVIDAQYGGLLSDSASVLVVCESWRLASGALVADGHTFDVRLARSGSGWAITAVHPSAPGPRTPALTTAARHVLGSARIHLPPAARADVSSGQVHDSVLEGMLTVAQRWLVSMSVVRSGHPLYVFGTSRRSDHPRGRAFDTWAIDGIPVVASGPPHRNVPAYMEALANLGAYNVGGPVLLGSAPQFFSDQTHHDHVHAGFAT